VARRNSARNKSDDALNPRQTRFCEEYVVDLDAHQAAARAGYSAKTAVSQGHRLLQNAKVQKKIQQLKMIRSDAIDSRAEDVIREVALLAHSDIADFINIDENGICSPKPFTQLKPGQSKCIQKIKQRRTVRKARDGSGDTIEESTFEFALWDKPRCLDLEGQYHTIWNQKSQELPEEAAATLLGNIADALEGRHGSSAPA